MGCPTAKTRSSPGSPSEAAARSICSRPDREPRGGIRLDLQMAGADVGMGCCTSSTSISGSRSGRRGRPGGGCWWGAKHILHDELDRPPAWWWAISTSGFWFRGRRSAGPCDGELHGPRHPADAIRPPPPAVPARSQSTGIEDLRPPTAFHVQPQAVLPAWPRTTSRWSPALRMAARPARGCDPPARGCGPGRGGHRSGSCTRPQQLARGEADCGGPRGWCGDAHPAEPPPMSFSSWPPEERARALPLPRAGPGRRRPCPRWTTNTLLELIRGLDDRRRLSRILEQKDCRPRHGGPTWWTSLPTRGRAEGRSSTSWRSRKSEEVPGPSSSYPEPVRAGRLMSPDFVARSRGRDGGGGDPSTSAARSPRSVPFELLRGRRPPATWSGRVPLAPGLPHRGAPRTTLSTLLDDEASERAGREMDREGRGPARGQSTIW